MDIKLHYVAGGVLMAVLATPVVSYAEPPVVDAAAEEPGFTTQLFASSRVNLLGDMGGLRSTLGSVGISLGLQDTNEVFGNVSGGVHKGAAYDGLTMLSVGLDTQKAFGWAGGVANISLLQIRGRNLSTDNLHSLATSSGIQADRTTRLWEAWYQQTLFDGRADVKLGQQSLDQEFIVSSNAGTFINMSFGWPALPSYDLYSGGPSYPLASLGMRVRVRPMAGVTVLGGVFNDNATGGPFAGDSQLLGAARTGTRFNLNTGALVIGEVQYAINQPAEGDAVNPAEPASGLAGTYKLGFWYDTAAFPDPRYDASGLPLANPNSSLVPRMRRQNYSVYGVADQVLWQPDLAAARSIGVFARIMGAPGDRNLVDFGLNAGVVMKAPLPGRDNDSFGVGYGLAKVSAAAAGFDRDVAQYSGAGYPVRSSESFFEVTYQYQAAPWWLLQPDAQYIFTPGGGIPNPVRPGRRIGNEAIFGMRSAINF